jgi:hypothetical protein
VGTSIAAALDRFETFTQAAPKHTLEILDAVGEVVDLRVPVAKATPSRDDVQLGPACVAALHAGGAHRTVAGIRYRICTTVLFGGPWRVALSLRLPDGDTRVRGEATITTGGRPVVFRIDTNDAGTPDEPAKLSSEGEFQTPGRWTRWKPGEYELTFDLDPLSANGKTMVVTVTRSDVSVRLPATGHFELRPYDYRLRFFDLKSPPETPR